MKKLLLTTALILGLASANSAGAYDRNTWLVGLGYYNSFEQDDDQDTVGGKLEYRSKAYSPRDLFGISNVSWIAGMDADLNGSVYGYGGLVYDWEFANDWYLTPNVAAGLYHQGGGKDLGGTFNFRSGIELHYAIDRESRVGIGIHHISNAGIYDNNPGTEMITATFSHSLK